MNVNDAIDVNYAMNNLNNLVRRQGPRHIVPFPPLRGNLENLEPINQVPQLLEGNLVPEQEFIAPANQGLFYLGERYFAPTADTGLKFYFGDQGSISSISLGVNLYGQPQASIGWSWCSWEPSAIKSKYEVYLDGSLKVGFSPNVRLLVKSRLSIPNDTSFSNESYALVSIPYAEGLKVGAKVRSSPKEGKNMQFVYQIDTTQLGAFLNRMPILYPRDYNVQIENTLFHFSVPASVEKEKESVEKEKEEVQTKDTISFPSRKTETIRSVESSNNLFPVMQSSPVLFFGILSVSFVLSALAFFRFSKTFGKKNI